MRLFISSDWGFPWNRKNSTILFLVRMQILGFSSCIISWMWLIWKVKLCIYKFYSLDEIKALSERICFISKSFWCFLLFKFYPPFTFLPNQRLALVFLKPSSRSVCLPVLFPVEPGYSRLPILNSFHHLFSTSRLPVTLFCLFVSSSFDIFCTIILWPLLWVYSYMPWITFTLDFDISKEMCLLKSTFFINSHTVNNAVGQIPQKWLIHIVVIKRVHLTSKNF